MRDAIRAVAVLAGLSAVIASLSGQQKISPRQTYERVMAVMPLVGLGTVEDPKRPMFAPAPKSVTPASRTGIIGFTYVLSDDGKSALCEFVARDRASLNGILTAPSVKSFVKGVHPQAAIEAEFKKYKKDFDINKFGVHVQ